MTFRFSDKMNHNITVLVATGTMNAGGTETLIMEMLRHRSDAVRYVMLIHHSGPVTPGVYDAEIRALGVPMVYIPSVGSIGAQRYTQIFRERVAGIGHVDILHSHLNAVGGIIARAAKKAGIRSRIVHCHADITYTGSRVGIALNECKLMLMKRYVDRYATACWACSEAAGKRLFHPGRPVKVIPNVIDAERFFRDEVARLAAKQRFDLEGRLVLGAVGRIAPIKNYEFALEVLAALKQMGEQAVFVCFGRAADAAYFRALQARSEELGVSGQVLFPGNSNQVAEDIACFDVFLMPSKSEGFGIAAIEAQAAGLPTLLSTGVPEIVDLELGLCRFLPFDAELWANTIRTLHNADRPSTEEIIKAFDRRGYNAPTAVHEIEKEYCRIAQGGEHGV